MIKRVKDKTEGFEVRSNTLMLFSAQIENFADLSSSTRKHAKN